MEGGGIEQQYIIIPCVKQTIGSNNDREDWMSDLGYADNCGSYEMHQASSVEVRWHLQEALSFMDCSTMTSLVESGH
jgi:hypothetical protein